MILVPCGFSPMQSLFRGEEAEDLAHHAIGLIGLEEKLSVRRAIQNDQLLWFRSLVELLADSGETRSIFAGIVACHDVQEGHLSLLAGLVVLS